MGFIFVTVLIDFIGFGLIIPVLPKLIGQLIHGDLSDAARYGGWLLFAYSSMQFLFAPVMGGLSDRFGRRPVLLFSLFGFGIDYLFLAFAPTIGWLFVGRIVAGITGASFTTASAEISCGCGSYRIPGADLYSGACRTKHLGLLQYGEISLG